MGNRTKNGFRNSHSPTWGTGVLAEDGAASRHYEENDARCAVWMVMLDIDDFLFEFFGFTYLLAWTVGLYPQVYLNYKTKQFTGLSPGYVILNLWGFICYFSYNVSRSIIQSKYGLAESVTFHDVLFAGHSCLLSLTLFSQYLLYRNKRTACISRVEYLILATLVFLPALAFVLAMFGLIEWFSTTGFSACLPPDKCSHGHLHFSFIQILGIIKIFVTICKYPSQIRVNFINKSTAGLSAIAVSSDTTGAVCSLAQNFVHAYLKNDMEYIQGNVPKLGLGSISFLYCTIILFQIWYYSDNKLRPSRVEYIELGQVVKMTKNEVTEKQEPETAVYGRPFKRKSTKSLAEDAYNLEQGNADMDWQQKSFSLFALQQF